MRRRSGHDDAGERLLSPPDGVFSESELAGLPAEAATHLRSAIAPGTPLATSVRIEMRGSIRIGRWVPFRAWEVLAPHTGFAWGARAAGVVVGSDRYVDGIGAMDWKLLGLVRVMSATGPDVSRSARERAAAEAVWVPTSMLPRFGVEWTVRGADLLSARIPVGEGGLRLDLSVSSGGRLASVSLPRWGDPGGSGRFGMHTFGGEFTDHGSFGGMTIPVEGRLGWHFGSDAWPEGEFFRFRITDLEPVTGDTA